MTDLLMIFTRNPELGKVKTRLAKTVGDRAALEIYTFLLEHTADIAREVQVDRQVHYSIDIREGDLWDREHFEKRKQSGTDLGMRMARAFEQGFQDGYQKIVIVGSDLYELQAADIERAFLSLDQHDVVIGPALDGGYYLLGMKQLEPALFQYKSWGTESVYKDTMDHLKDRSVAILETKNDIDTYEDLLGNPAFDPFLKDLDL